MLKLKSLLKNKTVVFTLKITVALFVCYLAFYTFRQCEGFGDKKQLVYLSMDGCPHCVKMTPHWNAAKAANKTDVVMTEYERGSEKGKEMCKKYGVTGFPTVLLLQGDKKKDTYKDERTKNGILSYLKSL